MKTLCQQNDDLVPRDLVLGDYLEPDDNLIFGYNQAICWSTGKENKRLFNRNLFSVIMTTTFEKVRHHFQFTEQQSIPERFLNLSMNIYFNIYLLGTNFSFNVLYSFLFVLLAISIFHY